MSYDVTKLTTLGQLGLLGTKTAAELAKAFKSLSVSGNTISFYTTEDSTGTAAATVDFPEEIFLDQAGTTLVQNFSWSLATYPNSTNPNLDGKTVLVLAVKGDKETNPTVKYSFVDVSKLIDIYTAADNSIEINASSNTVKVKISETAGNALSLAVDGLYVDAASKVNPATAGNIPLLESDGSLVNSTIVGADVVTKVANATSGNVATLDENGKLADSGHAIATDAEVTEYLNSIFS